jgi:hypothetical protein
VEVIDVILRDVSLEGSSVGYHKLAGGSALPAGAHIRLPRINDILEFGESSQRIAERDVFRSASDMLGRFFHQSIEPAIDGKSSLFDPQPQFSPVGFKQRNVKQVLPIISPERSHFRASQT